MTSANKSHEKKKFPSGWKCYKTIGSYVSCAFIEIWSTLTYEPVVNSYTPNKCLKCGHECMVKKKFMMANLSIIFQIQKKILLTSLNFVPLTTTAIFFFWRKNRSARGLLNDRKTHGPSAQAILESVQFLAYFSPPRLKSTRPAAVQKVSILRLAIFQKTYNWKKKTSGATRSRILYWLWMNVTNQLMQHDTQA